MNFPFYPLMLTILIIFVMEKFLLIKPLLYELHINFPKVLVIPRKRWLGPNMSEKLFTGTLRINQPTNFHTCDIPRSRRVFPILSPFTRRSSRRAKSPAFSIVLSVFFFRLTNFMSTVIYGIVYTRRRPQLKIQKD